MGARTMTNIYERTSYEYDGKYYKSDEYGISLYQHCGEDGGCCLNAALYVDDGNFFNNILNDKERELIVNEAFGDVTVADCLGVDCFMALQRNILEKQVSVCEPPDTSYFGFAAIVVNLNVGIGYLDDEQCELAKKGEGRYASYVARSGGFSFNAADALKGEMFYDNYKLVMPLEVYYKEAVRDRNKEFEDIGLSIIKKLKQHYNIVDVSPQYINALNQGYGSVYVLCDRNNLVDTIDYYSNKENIPETYHDRRNAEELLRQFVEKEKKLLDVQYKALGKYAKKSSIAAITDDPDETFKNALNNKVAVAEYCVSNGVELSEMMRQFLPANSDKFADFASDAATKTKSTTKRPKI